MNNPLNDPLIGEYANITRSVYVSKSHLQEWEVTARFEKVEFPIRVFGEVAVKLKQCGLVLEVGKAQDFSKAPYLFVIGYDAKHNRRSIEAMHTADGLKVLADLPRRAPMESEAPATESASKESPHTVTQVTPNSRAAKLALMKQLGNELLADTPEESSERSYIAMILMNIAVLSGESMTPPKKITPKNMQLQNNPALWNPKRETLGRE